MSTEKILSELYIKVRQLPIVAHIIDRLWLELPRDLYYHSASHSEDVLRQAGSYLAKAVGYDATAN